MRASFAAAHRARFGFDPGDAPLVIDAVAVEAIGRYRLLGETPPQFCHTPLLLAPDGRRLSKRDADLGLDALRARGFTAADIVGALAFAAGLQAAPTPILPEQLAPGFCWANVKQEDVRLPANLLEGTAP